MLGKTEEWSWEEIRALILFLSDVGFRNEEICCKIRDVCGHHSVSKDEVYHTIAADKQAKVLANGSSDPFDVPLADDEVEISNFLNLYDERVTNYFVQSSKYKWNQWNCIRKKLHNRECHSPSQHPSSDVEKATDLQNSSEVRDKVLHEKLHAILKNFSPQNFSVSASEIKELHITTEGNLSDVIDIVFEKAIEKPNFSIPYANMCKCLSLLKVPCSGQKDQFVDTGELLFAKCQNEFERKEVNQLCREGAKEQFQKISEEKLTRRRQLGTARFMGWLFKLGIFTESMIHQIIEILLLQDNEIAVSCVCLLIAAVGNELDGNKVTELDNNKVTELDNNKVTELDRNKIESYISDLKKKIDKPYASSKLAVILQEISDLKMNNWEKSSKIIDEILNEDQEGKKMECLSGDNEKQESSLTLQAPVEMKQYDRKFLLNLQYHSKSMKRPVDLPYLDRIKIKGVTSFTPSFQVQQNAAPAVATSVSSEGLLLPLTVSLQEQGLPDGVIDSSVISVQLHDSPMPSSEEIDRKDVKKLPVKKDPKNKTTLKYSENQWSPWNPEGKRQYDREFLLNLQSQPLSMKKPSNLPDIDVIKDKATLQKLKEMNNKTVEQVSRDKKCSLMAKAKCKETNSKIISAAQYASRAGYTDPFEPATAVGHDPSVHKKVLGILTKLTPQKFGTLVSQLKQLDITTEESLNGVTDVVFEKAISEPKFSVLCANLCKHLALLKVASGVEGQFVNFRKLLLTKCQREFEKDRTDEQNREERIRLIQESETDEKRKQLQEEFDEEERKNRRRQLGNIRFIGELFNLGMLTESIMHQCIKKLLNQGDEDSLECVCCLLTTIGKELEKGKNAALMESYFTDIKKVVDERQTTSSVRFILQDVIDLRVVCIHNDHSK